MPSTVRFATNGIFNESIQYKYDNMGNIVEIFENGRSTCRYEYDALGRITREDNVAFGKTTTWAYDNNGNILARYEYAITAKPTSELHFLDSTCVNYAYVDNSDMLMSCGDEAFEYDLIGNPTIYRGKTSTWACGRELVEYDGNTFSYDARGRRIGKNDITFTYDSNGNLIKQSNGLEFFYDHTGVFAVKYNDATYFYRKNAQNDIIALLDNMGNVVVKYVYDAWGNCQITVVDENATAIAELNPFRYRSYYYDHGIGLYFLKTRYYDPEIGRFITIDDISYLAPNSINGLNLYAYCGNNPVNRLDPNGDFWVATLIVAAVVVGCTVSLSGCSNASPEIPPSEGELTSGVGAAPEYRYISGRLSDSPNCYNYAINRSGSSNPGSYSGFNAAPYNDVDLVSEAVIKDLNSMGRSARKISGYDAPIYSNEYRIAVRVGTTPVRKFFWIKNYDYHFMVQTSTGQWAEKHGTKGDSILHGYGMNPSEIKWTLRGEEYYDSEIIYIAISK